jgi:hypothetical protein
MVAQKITDSTDPDLEHCTNVNVIQSKMKRPYRYPPNATLTVCAALQIAHVLDLCP